MPDSSGRWQTLCLSIEGTDFTVEFDIQQTNSSLFTLESGFRREKSFTVPAHDSVCISGPFLRWPGFFVLRRTSLSASRPRRTKRTWEIEIDRGCVCELKAVWRSVFKSQHWRSRRNELWKADIKIHVLGGTLTQTARRGLKSLRC